MIPFDMVLIGVGGQGVVTLGDLIARAAQEADVPVSYVPTKGMAQRGGFVKVEIRLGRDNAGPRVPEHGADLVLSMERSEALKGLPSIASDGRFVLYDYVWEPTGVMLGEDDYPSLESVRDALSCAAGDVVILDPQERPRYGQQRVQANVFALGAMFATPRLQALINPDVMDSILQARWPKAAQANGLAFRAGIDQSLAATKRQLGGDFGVVG